MGLIRNMRAGARLWADSTDSQTTGRGKKYTGKGCNVTRGGTKQLSVFCHMKPPRNIYVTETVDPDAMGVFPFV